jgi:hypothetical protein
MSKADTDETPSIFVEVTGNEISIGDISSRVKDPGAGAIATFTGVTRNVFNGKDVLKLEYEAYVPMAVKKLKVCIRIMLLVACRTVFERQRFKPNLRTKPDCRRFVYKPRQSGK